MSDRIMLKSGDSTIQLIGDAKGGIIVAQESVIEGSTLYDGGGANKALQTLTTMATLVAGGEDVITVGDANLIEVFLVNSTASSSGSLLVVESNFEIPTVASCIRAVEATISATDQVCTVDRAIIGLTTGTEYAPKIPVRITVTPNSYIMLAMSSSSGGIWYARYTLLRG